MKVLTRVLLVAVVGVALLLGSAMVFVAAVDENSLVAWLVQRVEKTSDTRISHSGDVSLARGLSPTLTVRGLEVADNDRRFSAKTSSLGIQINLLKIFIGRLDIAALSIGETHIEIDAGEPATGDGATPWFKSRVDLSALRLRPIIHQVTVDSLAVTRDTENWQLAASQINRLSLQLQTSEDIPALSADFNIVGQVMHVDASLPNFHKALKSGKLPFSVGFVGPLASGALVGELDFTGPDAAVQAKLQAQAKDLSNYPSGIDGLQVPGSFNLEAGISGKLEAPLLRDIQAQWQGPAASQLTLTGRVGDAVAFEQLDLQLAGKLENTDWLRAVLPESLPLSTVEVNSAMSGKLELVTLGDLRLKAETTESLVINLDGDAQLAEGKDGNYALRNIAAKLRFSAPTTRAARFILFDAVPEFGAVSCTADVTSTQAHARIENIDLKTEHEEGIKVALSGGIGEFPLDAAPNRGYDLAVSIAANEANTVIRSVDLDLPLSGPMQLSFRIAGDTPALQLNNIALKAGSDKALEINADGSMHFGDWSRPDPLQSIAMDIQAYSHTTAAFEKFIHDDGNLPNLGALKIRGKLQTVTAKHRVDGFSLTTTGTARVQVALTGTASDLVLFPKPALAGIDLDILATGKEAADLNAFFSLATPWIPAVGAFEARSKITGSNETVAVDQTSISAGSKHILQLNASGRLGDIDASSGWKFYNAELKLQAASDSSQALARAMGHRVPAFGPLTASAMIHDKDKSFGLEALQVAVGSNTEDPVMTARGSIGDLYAGKDVDIDVEVNIDGHNLAAFADQHSLKDLAPLTGSLKVADTQGVPGIQTLSLNSSHEALSVAVDGSFTDFSKPETLALQARVNARDLALVGALFGRDWPDYAPFELRSDIGRDGQRLNMTTTVLAGNKSLDVQLHREHTGEVPAYVGKVTAQQLSLPDFYVTAAEKRKARKKDSKQQQEPLFSREPIGFDVLKKFDLALVIDVDSFDRSDSEAESADFTVNLKDGHLRVNPAVVKYPKGQLDIELSVDARDETPAITYKASGKDLNPWLGLSAAEGVKGGKDPVNAEMDVAIRLAASGRSPHELAASLDGDLYLTIKDGRMRRSFTDLLFVDIVGWTSSLVKDERYLPLSCGLLDLRADQGVVTTSAFFMDTPNITITGEGDVDLANEKVDYVFLPRKKSRIILNAEPVKVTGALADPHVQAIPVKSAALTFGTLIFAPYVFVGMAASEYVVGKFNGKEGVTPCLSYERKQPVTGLAEPSVNEEE